MNRHVAALLVAIVCVAPAHAITVIPLTFEQLVEEATVVVYARVSGVRGRWTADRRSIESVVTLEAIRYFKGDFGPALTMRLPGGEAGGFISVLPGAPVLGHGDFAVLFLGARGPSLLTPVGLTQGVFRVVTEARTGTVLVTPPPLRTGTGGRVVRGGVDRRALTLDLFGAEVRAVQEAAR